ncbi:type IV pilus biogenesis/stability protein PilW [Chitinolyticbacter meiyuanensis]|uniref:type IV pilus biogenesis/stability protein PilW n=1 Tax=Chitinolyticbacter meiyuanensis TaxID=682798 RepID=UPI0011E5E84A|nr:type IV pilus biogenesis/stability protein PilW [Chitinolyticbacter meiyuanensis]
MQQGWMAWGRWAMGLLLCCVAILPVAANPNNDLASIRTQLAVGYFQRGQYAVAIDEANKALAANPRFAAANNILGLIYAELKEPQKAREQFQRALSLSPDDPDINHNYGWFLCEQGQTQEGIAFYMNALKNPLYATPDKTLVNAGQCALKAGEVQAARDYFERAIKQRPDNILARVQLAELSLKLGDPVAAKRHFIDLQKRLPESAELLWLGVRIEHLVGNREAEAKLAAQLKNRFPDSLETTKLLTGKYD